MAEQQTKPNLIKRITNALTFSSAMSIASQAFADYMVMSRASLGYMNENIALRQPALWRAIDIIASTIGSLPLKSYRTKDDGERQEIRSFLDNPAPMELTRVAWMELVMTILLLNGEVGLQKIRNGAGALIQLMPVHPLNYQVRIDGIDKIFSIQQPGGKVQDLTSNDFCHIMWRTLDGVRGISPITLFRETMELSTAQQTAASRALNSGALFGGMVTANEEIDETTAMGIMANLKEKATGPENAGAFAFINKNLNITPWTANARDLQFLESREFSVHDAARMYGVPAHMLFSSSKEQSFASGLQEQMAEFQKTCLMGWTTRLEETFSAMLPAPQHAEFIWTGLLQGTPSEQINTLLAQTGKPFLTVNEARKLMNLEPVPNGDDLAPALATPVPEAAPTKDVVEKHSLPPVKTYTKRITKIRKGSNGELITSTEEQ